MATQENEHLASLSTLSATGHPTPAILMKFYICKGLLSSLLFLEGGLLVRLLLVCFKFFTINFIMVIVKDIK